jgi:peptide/nickel transport system substrate-binding protein
MKGKAVRLVLIPLSSVLLALAACIPTSNSTPPPLDTRTTTTAISPPVPTGTTMPDGKPRYGGTLNLMFNLDFTVFDPVASGQMMGIPGWLINEQYVGEDWAKGSAGSGEINWSPNTGVAPGNGTGILAESWEMPALGTIVFKVRPGVHWALDPKSEASRLMNGREVTADDWIINFDYFMHHPRSLIRFAPQLATATMDKTGPWEVTLNTIDDPLMGWSWFACGASFFLLPPEVLAKYGDMQDWRNVVGTGPFMVTDFVASSSVTLTKNPHFWEKDPVGVGKGNQLPYLDGVKMLIIPDTSTRLAAIRTGKIDSAGGVESEDAKSVLRSIPSLKQRRYLPLLSTMVAMRVDKDDLPYKDKRVRQALMMATDFDSLKNDFYGGDAEILAYPVTMDSKTVYVPLKDMPETVQALYRHDPVKAKDLLAEAGYPDGFKAKMILYNGLSSVDVAAIYKDMWAEVGIDLELQPKEQAVYNAIAYGRAYDDMMLQHQPGAAQYPGCLNFFYFRGFYTNDQVVNAASQEIQKYVIVNMAEADRIYREMLPYVLEQAYYIPTPTPTNYTLWWPWLKNFYGENPIRFAAYSWIDQDLKQEMAEGK